MGVARRKGLAVIYPLASRHLSGPFWREGFYREEGEVSRLPKINGDNCLLLFLHLWHPLRSCCLRARSLWQSSAHLFGLL